MSERSITNPALVSITRGFDLDWGLAVTTIKRADGYEFVGAAQHSFEMADDRAWGMFEAEPMHDLPPRAKVVIAAPDDASQFVVNRLA